MNRRSFIKFGTLGVTSTMIPQLAAAAERENKALIWIWLGGGISHIDFTHPIPNAPVEFREVNGSIATKGSYRLGADFPNLAKIGDKLSPVVAFNHRDGNHYTATHWLMTGALGTTIPENGPQKEPSYGSVISSLYGANAANGISTYVKTARIAHDDAVWLGATHMGFECSKEGIDNLRLNIPKDRFARRTDMVKIIDRSGDYLYDEHAKLRNQATQVILGEAGNAFDIAKANSKDIELYQVKTNKFGEHLLTARRVVEAGTRFVTVTHGGWDMHQGISMAMKARTAEIDSLIALLIQDLEEHGLLKSTMIVIASEFGRTPKINRDSGRDHFPNLISLMLAGGKYNHGNAIGKYDDKAVEPITTPFSPYDLTATIFDHFGLDIKHKFIDNVNRPRYLTEGDVKVILS